MIYFIGTLVFFLISVEDVGGPNLWSLHRLPVLSGKEIVEVSNGCTSVHCVVIDSEGKAYTWGQYNISDI